MTHFAFTCLQTLPSYILTGYSLILRAAHTYTRTHIRTAIKIESAGVREEINACETQKHTAKGVVRQREYLQSSVQKSLGEIYVRLVAYVTTGFTDVVGLSEAVRQRQQQQERRNGFDRAMFFNARVVYEGAKERTRTGC